MSQITKTTFLPELLKNIPEFKEIHEANKSYHDIGLNLIFGDFLIFFQQAVDQDDFKLIGKIATFLIACWKDYDDDVINALFVSFFEHLEDRYLQTLYPKFPWKFTQEIKEYQKAWDEFSKKK